MIYDKDEAIELIKEFGDDVKWFVVGFTKDELNESIRAVTGRDATETEMEKVLARCADEMGSLSALCREDVDFWLNDMENQEGE